MYNRAELKDDAWFKLKGNWGVPIVATMIPVVLSLICDMVSPVLTVLVSAFIAAGICKFSLNFTQGREYKVSDVFSGANVFLKVLGIMLLTSVAVVIGTILLIIPGIIAAVMLSQAVYVLVDDNSKTVMECLKESKDMMKGNIGKYIMFELSFVGWVLLTVFTFGVASLWAIPYMAIAEANFYLYVRDSKLDDNNKEELMA